MIAAQLDDTVATHKPGCALRRPRYDTAQDVVERRVRFDE
jgi:hypothetical protein